MALTSAAFWQVNTCDFINLDDIDYVTENSHIRNGITMEGIQWAITTSHSANWHPLTWISHMLDIQLFGLKPRWHHLINLLFHVSNTVLLFLVLRKMTKAIWRSAFVAALFALHPLHVQSVAWVAERKDVLSTFFWMLTMGAYIYYVELPGVRRYLPVLLFFALGLMAKPMLVTLPFVLLLLDCWPLQRLQEIPPIQEIRTVVSEAVSSDKRKGKSKRKPADYGVVKTEIPADRQFQWSLIRPLLWEKVPLFALAALSSIVTFIVQQKAGAMKSIETFPQGIRFADVFVSYIIYIGQMIWPSDLAVFYPHPGLRPLWQVLGAILLLTAVTLTVIWRVKRFPYLAMGWLWYLGTLVPVIGIVRVGEQAGADRYTYIPLIGLFIMASWGIPELLKKWPSRKAVLLASSALSLSCLCVVTWTQVGYWQNSITLFDHTLKVTGHNSVAYYCRGHAYNGLGNYRQAIADYDRAIEISPRFADAYRNRAEAHNALGNHKQAIADSDRALEINQNNAGTYYQRGVAHYSLGNHKQAIADFDRAVEISPDYAMAYNNRGIAYCRVGNYRQGIADFDKVIEINPRVSDAYNNRGNAYYRLGNYGQAIDNYDRAIEISPDYARGYYNRGIAYDGFGNQKQAVEDLKTAARLGYEEAKSLLGGQGIKW